MTMKEDGCAVLAALLRRRAADASRAARGQVGREGARVGEVARGMAPADRAGLEEAIRVEPVRDDRARLTVEIGFDASGDAGAYAAAMHEGLGSWGDGGPVDDRMGPLSRARIADGKAVGGKFLERALAERGPYLAEAIAAAVRKEVG